MIGVVVKAQTSARPSYLIAGIVRSLAIGRHLEANGQGWRRKLLGSARWGQHRCHNVAFIRGWAAGPPQGPIKSLSHPYVKHCVRLRESASYRKDSGTVLVPGSDVLQELAGHDRSPRIRVLLLVNQQHPLHALLNPEAVVVTTEDVLRKITGLRSVGGVEAVAEVELPRPVDFAESFQKGSLRRLLVVDGVQDPGNLGTLIRTATGLGWQAAFLLDGCCDPFNEKAVRAGKGAAFRLPLAWGGLPQLLSLQRAHGLSLLAALPREGTGSEAGPPAAAPGEGGGGVGLVLGSEGRGVRPEVALACNPLVIPMADNWESLNVSQAGAILMFMLSPALPAVSLQLQRLGLLGPPTGLPHSESS